MSKLMRISLGAVAAVGLLVGAGCQERERPLDEGQGGAGFEQTQDTYQGTETDEDSARLGDGKIGENEGVIDDGEGPLEENQGGAGVDTGEEPGVINDGEGPIEEHEEFNREPDRTEQQTE